MKIGIVVPWIHRMGANKIPFSLVRGLANLGHDAFLIAHTVNQELLPSIEIGIRPASLIHAKSDTQPYSYGSAAWKWFASSRSDIELAEVVLDCHKSNALDFVVLIGNEGFRLASLLRKKHVSSLPLLGWSIMELIDHSFLLRRDRPYSTIRAMLAPLYPLIHREWERAMKDFDFLCANSEWTADLVAYLYGLDCQHNLISLPSDAFGEASPNPRAPDHPYIALPTVSIGPVEKMMVTELARRGLPLRAFGDNKVPDVDNLGYLSEEAMRSEVAGAAALLFLFDYEALGLVPFEALAQGVPVVTIPKYGVKRQWAGNPFVSMESTVDGLVTSCNRWLASPLTAELRAQASATVQRFAEESAARSFLEFLSRLEKD